ncbi:MAG: CRISPR-associated protein Cas4 [Pyrodictiaceae archaeon]
MSTAIQSSRIEIPIILVKEYAYCPRIAYYKYFTIWEPPTESMKSPRYTKTWLAKLLRSHGIKGEILTEYPVRSRRLGIYGRVDAVVVSDKELYVVEAKLDSSRAKLRRKAFHHLIQLTAYAMAAEETFHKSIRKSLIIVLSRNDIVEVTITPSLRRTLLNIVNEFKRYVAEQELPPRTVKRSRCRYCFYRKICWMA